MCCTRATTFGSRINSPAPEGPVSLIGPKGRLDHVRVVGPARDHDQVEVSRTDALHLGIDPPLRESGDLARTPGIRIEGPVGMIDLSSGVICSLRHLHASPADAAVLGLHDRDRVEISSRQASVR